MRALDEATRDLRRSLQAVNVLDTFYRLPSSEQSRFLDWIAKAHDEEAYRRRIDILTLAMRMAPPAKPSKHAPPAAPGVLG